MDTLFEKRVASAPVAEAHPVNLAVLGRLHGIETVEPSQARVLEIYCGEGGHLLPIAWQFPLCQCVGVDETESRVSKANSIINNSGLKNIRIVSGDLESALIDYNKFDYIIVREELCYLSDGKRRALLEVCRKRLSDNGVAYFGYNTLPGWHTRGILREMLQRRLRHIKTPTERIEAAFETLEFLKQTLAAIESPQARLLLGEIEELTDADPSSLYQEYLDEFNTPVWFEDFGSELQHVQLSYLCDVELTTSAPSTLGAAVEQRFRGVDNLWEREQLIDYVRLRTFRQSVVLSSKLVPSIAPDPSIAPRLAFAADLSPPEVLDLTRETPVRFVSARGHEVEVRSPLVKASLMLLHKHYPDSIAYPVLLSAAQRVLDKVKASHYKQDASTLERELFLLYSSRFILAETSPRAFTSKREGGLLAAPLARAQSSSRKVATIRHATLLLDDLGVGILELLDGQLTRDMLIEKIMSQLRSGQLRTELWLEKQPEKLRLQVSIYVDHWLKIFNRHGLIM